MTRINVKAILADADLRRKLMVSTIQATQAREGIATTTEQADRAYYVVSEGERATFFDLERFKGGKGEPDRRHEMFVRTLTDGTERLRYDVARRDFAAIDGCPLAFKRIGLVAHIFRECPSLEPTWADLRQGLSTADDLRFVRHRWELPINHIGQGKPWVPFAKGGDFSRFYQPFDLIVSWEDDGTEIKEYNSQLYGGGHWSRQVRSPGYYFRAGLTWPLRTQRGFNVRKMPAGCIFGHKGPGIFLRDPRDEDFVLGVMSSALAEYILRGLMSFGSWEVGIVKRLPIPEPSATRYRQISALVRAIYDAKAAWDAGNEISTSFRNPWLLKEDATSPSPSLAALLDLLKICEVREETHIRKLSDDLNEEIYRLYGIPDITRETIEETLGDRPAEIIWPQMERKANDQKRMEHVWRLLSYATKRVLEADDDGIVPFNAVNGEPRLVER
ncbi:hypothetical protein, partial [uncultured Thiodictyon sp.]|uniref:hypothetical protein n=1 Tax=uncultured Thiodictyon sp. TaxID=1846217 RepID=UPI0025F266D5